MPRIPSYTASYTGTGKSSNSFQRATSEGAGMKGAAWAKFGGVVAEIGVDLFAKEQE